MKKRNKIILTLLLTTLLFSSAVPGCSSETITINVEKTEELHNTILGQDALIRIGNGLYYDTTTRIVYLWNGYTYSEYASTPCPYYAPNGLPYKYNPGTNTLEEIE